MHALTICIVGIIGDMDHIIDCLLQSEHEDVLSILVFGKGFIRPRLTDLVLHSWEFLFLLSPLTKWIDSILIVGLIGYASHLLTDTIFNYIRYGANPLTCFLSYRILKHNDRLEEYQKRLIIRDLVLERDNHRCRMCGSRDNIEVHMEKFAFGNESTEHYIAVCHLCHLKKHLPSLAIPILSRLSPKSLKSS